MPAAAPLVLCRGEEEAGCSAPPLASAPPAVERKREAQGAAQGAAAAAQGAAVADPRGGPADDLRSGELQGLRGEGVEADQLQVIEVETQGEKMAAFGCHMSKNTFLGERDLVQLRIFNGEEPHLRCRTWALVHRSKMTDLQKNDALHTEASASGRGRRGRGGGRGRGGRGRGGRGSGGPDLGPALLAAVTVRINSYGRGEGRWAQILNMSSKSEGHGHGNMLIAGLEELLRREDIDVVVLYPADNGRAPAFWSSIGFGKREASFLPEEELLTHDKGGPLLPEYDPVSNKHLPRWEKRIRLPLHPKTMAAKRGRPGQEGEAGGQPEHRALAAASSRLEGAALRDAAGVLLLQRRRSPRRFA